MTGNDAWHLIEKRAVGDTCVMNIYRNGKQIGVLYRAREWSGEGDTSSCSVALAFVPCGEE